ncbi:MAG: glutamine amidotransferase [Burkholderiaceae bacterium]
MKPVLLAGETFQVTSTVARGYDVGSSYHYVNGSRRFTEALSAHNIKLHQTGGERCGTEFPRSFEGLDRYCAAILSDVDALSLYISPQTRAYHPSVDRLDLLLGGSKMAEV